MKKKHVTLNYTFVFLMIMFLIQTACGNEDSKPNIAESTMKFWEIIVDSDGNTVIGPDYEYGEGRFPNYSFYRLPKQFIIRKKPDLIIKGDQIEEITIKNERKKSAKPLYVAIIRFKPDIKSLMNNYTKKNMKKLILIEIDNNIVSVNMIMDEVVDEAKIYLMGDFKEIEKNFSKLKCNMNIIEG